MSINEIESFFKNNTIVQPFLLSLGITIIDYQLFVESHIGIIKANGKEGCYGVYFERLIDLKTKIENKQNGSKKIERVRQE